MSEHHRRGGGTSLADDDDLLREILLRLPPQPSSLLRASLVCKHWRGLVNDPRFLRRFRTHHGKPPLLGFFLKDDENGHPFLPILEPPDCIHAKRFTCPIEQLGHDFDLVDCRHGLVLLKTDERRQLLIWDPVTDERRCVSIPPLHINGEELCLHDEGVVRCVNRDQGHVHGHCHSGPFQVALRVGPAGHYDREFICVYSSATDTWSDPVSTKFQPQITLNISGAMRSQGTLITMVGDSLYWMSLSLCCIIEYNFDRHNLSVIRLPPDVNALNDCVFTLMPAEDGGLGLILVSNFSAQLWKREAASDGATAWVPGRTIKLGKLTSVAKNLPLYIVGFAEENSVMLIWTARGVFMVDIQSAKIKKLCNNSDEQVYPESFYPFASFYVPGKGKIGRNDGYACCTIQQGT